MLLARRSGQPAYDIVTPDDAKGAIWLDLLRPTEHEIALAERITGCKMPRREELEEIESSSRHYKRGDAIYLSMPLIRRIDDTITALPVGLVLTPAWCVSVRYSDYNAFDNLGRDIASATSSSPALDVPDFPLMILEAVVNRLADVLEGVGRELDLISRRVFSADAPRHRERAAEKLRQTLRHLGHSGDMTSSTRDSLLGVDRIGIFLGDIGYFQANNALLARLKTLGRDVASLNDFCAQMANKVQFLLDATLGFISIEQNDGMKLLTVVSFVGIAPTLIAGVYGMNFKNMPELQWRDGYYYSLALMGLSVLLPLGYFWQRGWFGDRR